MALYRISCAMISIIIYFRRHIRYWFSHMLSLNLKRCEFRSQLKKISTKLGGRMAIDRKEGC